MGSRKVTRTSSSFDAEQLAQLPEHKEEGPAEDLLKDFPSPPEPSTFPSRSLALSAATPTRLDSGILTPNDVHLARALINTPVVSSFSCDDDFLLFPCFRSSCFSFLRYSTVIALYTAHNEAQQTWGAPPYIQMDDPTPSPPLYSLPNLVPPSITTALPPLPNLAFPVASQPALSELYFSSTVHVPVSNSPLAYHLQVQPVSDKFEIQEMPIFGLDFDPTDHVVNYNIYMELRTTFDGLKCKAFFATLDEEGNMWFASFAFGSITCFKQLTNLNEPLQDYITRFNHEARKVPYFPTEGIKNHELTRELDLRRQSMCELNKVISRHISTEETEKWRAK
ncbi:hypothetical protein ACLOJK_011965 [Asimina triloba]